MQKNHITMGGKGMPLENSRMDCGEEKAPSKNSESSAGLPNSDKTLQNYQESSSDHSNSKLNFMKISICFSINGERDTLKLECKEQVPAKKPEENSGENSLRHSKVESPSISCHSISISLQPESSDEELEVKSKISNGKKVSFCNTKEYILPLAGNNNILPETDQMVYRAYLPCSLQLPQDMPRNQKEMESHDLQKRMAELEKQVEEIPILQNKIRLLEREKAVLQIEVMSKSVPNLKQVTVDDFRQSESRSVELEIRDSVQATRSKYFSDDFKNSKEGSLNKEKAADPYTTQSEPSPDSPSEILSHSFRDGMKISSCVCTRSEFRHVNEPLDTHIYNDNEKELIDVSTDTVDLFIKRDGDLSSELPKWIDKAPSYKNLIMAKKIPCPIFPNNTRHCSTTKSVHTQTTADNSNVDSGFTTGLYIAAGNSSFSDSPTQLLRPSEDQGVNDMCSSQSIPNNASLRNEDVLNLKTRMVSANRGVRKEAIVRPCPRIPAPEPQTFSNGTYGNNTSNNSYSTASVSTESDDHVFESFDSAGVRDTREEDTQQVQTTSIIFYCLSTQLRKFQRLGGIEKNSLFVKLCQTCYHLVKDATLNGDRSVRSSGNTTAACRNNSRNRTIVQGDILFRYPDGRWPSSAYAPATSVTNRTRGPPYTHPLTANKRRCVERCKSSPGVYLSATPRDPNRSPGRVSIAHSWPQQLRSSHAPHCPQHRRNKNLGLQRSRPCQMEEPPTEEDSDFVVGDSCNLFRRSPGKGKTAELNNGSQTFGNNLGDRSEIPKKIEDSAAHIELSGITDVQYGYNTPVDIRHDDFVDACEIINTYLQDLDKERDEILKRQVILVQERWFKIAGSRQSSGNLVQEYLQFFQCLSSEMVKWIVSSLDPDDNTVLNFALANSNFEVVRLLLETGFCDLDRPNKAGHTAIIICASSRPETEIDLFVIESILRIGNVNFRSLQHGQTALMVAVSYGNKEMAKMLMEAGADVNAQDDDGSTALMFAAERGDMDCSRLLLANPKCDPSLKDNYGLNACMVALNADHSDVGLLIYARTTGIKVATKFKRIRGYRI